MLVLLRATLPPDTRRRPRVRPTCASRLARRSRAGSRTVLALAGCRLRLEGAENLGGTGILAANHSSYLDVVALLAALPVDVRFVAKRELERTPLVGTVIRKVGHLTVERFDLSRSVADAERVARALRDVVPLLFFPEGTFTAAPGLLPFRLGAFKAAVEAGGAPSRRIRQQWRACANGHKFLKKSDRADRPGDRRLARRPGAAPAIETEPVLRDHPTAPAVQPRAFAVAVKSLTPEDPGSRCARRDQAALKPFHRLTPCKG